MSIKKPNMDDLTFEDIHYQNGIGKSLSEGQGRHKKYSYWNGVQTKIGEFELSEWTTLALELIKYKGEQTLFAQLLEHSNNYKWLKQDDEKKQYALQMHCARMFDRPGWVDYLPFNRKYRPECIQTENIIMIVPACCREPGEIMRQQLWSNRAPCPHCGRSTEYKIVENRSFMSDVQWV